MRVLISILFIFSISFVSAQNFADKSYYLVDSLDFSQLTASDSGLIESSLKLFHSSKSDTSKITALNGICNNMMHNDWIKFQYVQHEIIQEAIDKLPSDIDENSSLKRKLLIHLANSYNNIGYDYGRKGNISKQTDYYQKSLKIREKVGDQYGVAASLNNIGYIFNGQGDVPKALEYYHNALKILRKIDNKQTIAITLDNIAQIYLSQKDFETALGYYKESLEINIEIDEKAGIARTYSGLGSLYMELGEIEKSIDSHEKALIINREIGNSRGLATSLTNIGFIYDKKGNKSKAKNYYEEALAIQNNIGDKNGKVTTLINLGFIEYFENRINSSLKYSEEAYEIAKNSGSPELIKRSTGLLYLVYEELNRNKEALELFKLHISMRDSLNSLATLQASAQQEAKYAYEKKKELDDIEHENQKLLDKKEAEQKLALEHEGKQRQLILSISIGVVLFLVIIFLIFVFNRLRITNKQKKTIEKQKEIVEHAHKEITDSINYAERIQRSFLATEELLNANLQEYFVFFQPKDVVSGDFYWAGKLSNNTFSMVNADSTGHGVPGAIMSILNISSIEGAVKEGLTNPADIFNSTRSTIIERLKKDGSKEGGKDGMDASIVCFDFKTLKMTYCAAQNPIWVIRGGEVIQIKPEKMPVGKHDKDYAPFVGGELQLQKGDQVYTLTDGFQDQFGGEKGKKFMVKKMREYVLSVSHLPMQEQHTKIAKVFSNWKGDNEQVDDVCLIGIKA